MSRQLLLLLLLLAIFAVAFYVLTLPQRISASALPKHQADLANGERMFHAGGCASCHAAPASSKCDDPKSADKRKLSGGRCLITPFGKFYVPNISPDGKSGIGGWSNLDFVNAMVRGVAPDGAHYYPAFPFTSYQRMRYEDLIDLKAYLDRLPAVASSVPDHDLPLVFRLRRGLGLWKRLYLDGRSFVADPAKSEKINRGAYLVAGPGHCGECHTPRNFFGGFLSSHAFAGAKAPEGKGYVPNLTPHPDGLGRWSEEEIVEVLTSGLTPDFDTIGGSMAAVQDNLARLPASDRDAIAAYLKSLPAKKPYKRLVKPTS